MLSVIGVSKKFGSLEALRPLSVDFMPGEVHAVVGENGAGKSTLMNVLGGFLAPTSGSVTLNGKPLPKGNPQRSRALGIEMIHQHFKLVPAFTIDENLRLSQLGIGDQSIEAIKVKAQQFGWDIPWSSRVQNVSVGTQQRVEILKSVATNPTVVIFDEPTAVLAKDEVAELLEFLRQLADQGKIVILIAHKIEEVLAASDRITVLRRGQHVGTMLRADTDATMLVEMMIGGLVDSLIASTAVSGEEVLEANEIWVRDDRNQFAVQGLDLKVTRGQIVGIGGVDGNGQVELAEALAGVRPLVKGTLTLKEKSLDFDSTFVGYVPQDRQVDGLAVELDLVENMTVSALMNGEPFSRPTQFEKATALIQQYAIKAESAGDLAKQLSGGNQQKVILARVLDQNPRVLVVVNPTRGLDVKAASFVHQKLIQAADGGAYVVVVTTDREELFAVTHRQWFLGRGKLYESEKAALES